MSGFSNSVVGGDGELIRESIHSPDYVPNTDGWSINRDGTAEFSNAIVRGSATLTDVDADHITINGGGFIESEGYDATEEGWRLTGDGNATFLDGVTIGHEDSPAGLILNGSLNFYDDFTPTWTNTGSATFSTNTGYYKRLGNDLIMVNIYAIANAAGSGANPVSVTIPDITIDRTAWQILTCHYQRSGSAFMTGTGLCLETGTAGTIDRIRIQNSGAVDEVFNLQGSFISNGTRIVLQGWLRAT
jgi:hypothetical protein